MTPLERLIVAHTRADRRYHMKLDLAVFAVVMAVVVVLWRAWP